MAFSSLAYIHTSAMSTAALSSAGDFDMALRAHLTNKFLSQFPPEFLKMRVGEFLKLSVSSEMFETPKTATRRSVRQKQQHPSSVLSSTLSSITKSVKRTLFPLRTPSKITVPATPSAQTPRLTIRPGTSSTVSRTVDRTVNRTVSRTVNHNAYVNTPSKRSTKVAQTPRHPPASPASTGIVQFQLEDGKVIDVDFSRSPKSALQEANLLGSEAIGEVKAKIETYANQFMQYLKFFKKFKPN